MFISNWSDPDVRWLVFTNWTLFGVTLICVGIVAYGIVLELLKRMRRRSPADVFADEHVVMVTDLGITMADGGENTESKRRKNQ